MTQFTRRFGVDMQLLKLRLSVPPEKRILALLDAYEFKIGALRARLRQQFPDLSDREINLKALEEIERGKNIHSQFKPFPTTPLPYSREENS